MAESPIRRLIEASSLGTPEAARLRSTTSDETARRIVERAEQLADADTQWEAQARARPCAPYYCPTAGDVECCPEHSGWDVCCDRTDLHQPISTLPTEGATDGPQ